MPTYTKKKRSNCIKPYHNNREVIVKHTKAMVCVASPSGIPPVMYIGAELVSSEGGSVNC